MYSIRTKGHFEEWNQSPNINGLYGGPYYSDANEYTVIEFDSIDSYPNGAQIDFQVIALLGTFEEDFSYGLRGSVFYGERSDWSKTQTLTINKNSNGITTQAPDNSEMPSNLNQSSFTWIELASITIIAVVLTFTATFFILRKTGNMK
jgi:tRNA threonylcarbamoyladenosine modification (KEOPS) complex  Pcc1 subunit